MRIHLNDDIKYDIKNKMTIYKFRINKTDH